jgi:hypothetical protein
MIAPATTTPTTTIAVFFCAGDILAQPETSSKDTMTATVFISVPLLRALIMAYIWRLVK